MPFDLKQFTIRRKVLKFLGAAFHVYDPAGRVVGYCAQKAFKLREDIRVYTDESLKTELLTIRARHIVDFSAAYDVVDPRAGAPVGTARRRGFTSIVRDSWELLDASERPVGRLQEDNLALALLRRFVGIVPQTFHLSSGAGERLATLRVHFNPFIYRMTVTVDSDAIDPRLVFGVAVLVAAIEGRQD